MPLKRPYPSVSGGSQATLPVDSIEITTLYGYSGAYQRVWRPFMDILGTIYGGGRLHAADLESVLVHKNRVFARFSAISTP
jgi:hypothetical protein